MIEDERIIELFFDRSEDAVKELDTKYGKLCHSLSYRILNSWQDAEECVNDAYLGVWNTIPPTKPNPLQSYLCKVVRNISLKRYYRNNAAKRNSRYEIAMQELESDLPASDTVETELAANELASIIESFLDTLKEENCVIFMRRYWFCNTYAEIANFTGISEKNVSVRLTRIRRQLKQYLIEREVSL
ncbi:MAG: sigma-70 family RNA polymerase sigma factor [Lachnospiraceae bacterium]|nr:sigma-70 family RNA polymerase sigma factor [Lachnospiraceae bacterium]